MILAAEALAARSSGRNCMQSIAERGLRIDRVFQFCEIAGVKPSSFSLSTTWITKYMPLAAILLITPDATQVEALSEDSAVTCHELSRRPIGTARAVRLAGGK
jgi:hypothetical protein